MIYRKIGNIFTVPFSNGERTFVCEEALLNHLRHKDYNYRMCTGCAFDQVCEWHTEEYSTMKKHCGMCIAEHRIDNNNVIFKEVK